MQVKRFKVNDKISLEELETVFTGLHYHRKGLVELPGEFSIRGGTVDVYPVTYRMPIRLEFRGDTIARIRDFSVADGRSLTTFEEIFLIPLSGQFERKIRRLEERLEAFEPIAAVSDLQRGDYIVHLHYGIGRFLGTKMIRMGGKKERCYAIEYANNEILYLSLKEPLERYIGGTAAAPKLQ